MAAIGSAVPILGAGGLSAAAAVAGSAAGSAAVAASFGGIYLHLFPFQSKNIIHQYFNQLSYQS